ncbi:hypothetical protein R4Z10_12590 [Niallia sp. XMNu-256]|uniref:hypothetical protein n=1 Tax=Niallia sp. XMNu-256 TaxID=3082444 RepID=UPI0030CF3AAF
MAQSTKNPETAKGTIVVTEVTKKRDLTKGSEVVASLNESLLNTWSENIDRAFAAQTELENLFLQTLDNKNGSYGVFNLDLSKIEEEQKNFYENLRETTKSNLQSVYGPSVSNAVDQYYAQVDTLTNQVQEFTLKPYKEGLNLLNQTQEQFKQTVQSSIEQQQKIREEFKNQIKSTQQAYFNLYEENLKIVLGFFK